MPWIAAAIAASALIGGASSMAGGQAQAKSADNAANISNDQYLQTRQDFAPWRASGVVALNQINALMGLGGPGSAAAPGSAGVPQPGGASNAFATPIVGKLYANQSTRGKTPIQDIEAALALGRPISDTSWAQAGFGPGGAGYYQTPSLAQANPNIVPMGSGAAPADAQTAQTAQTNAFANFRTDPGYQFAVDQGTKALTNSAAARGILNSGATAKALTNYGLGMADQQYGNYFSRLQSLAGLGQSATGSTASAGAASAANQGNALMAGGNARASAYGGVATAANQGAQNYLAYNMNQNGGSGYPFDNSVNITQPRYF